MTKYLGNLNFGIQVRYAIEAIVAGVIAGFGLWCVIFVFGIFANFILPFNMAEILSWFVYLGGVVFIFWLTGSFLSAAAAVVQIIAQLMRDTVHGP